MLFHVSYNEFVGHFDWLSASVRMRIYVGELLEFYRIEVKKNSISSIVAYNNIDYMSYNKYDHMDNTYYTTTCEIVYFTFEFDR